MSLSSDIVMREPFKTGYAEMCVLFFWNFTETSIVFWDFQAENFVFGLCDHFTLQRNKSSLVFLTFSTFFANLASFFHYVEISCSQTLNYYKFRFLF